jgi:hypothetical protein
LAKKGNDVLLKGLDEFRKFIGFQLDGESAGKHSSTSWLGRN